MTKVKNVKNVYLWSEVIVYMLQTRMSNCSSVYFYLFDIQMKYNKLAIRLNVEEALLVNVTLQMTLYYNVSALQNVRLTWQYIV